MKNYVYAIGEYFYQWLAARHHDRAYKAMERARWCRDRIQAVRRRWS
jgi:hypothetical protein